jgi:hypothetical protein
MLAFREKSVWSFGLIFTFDTAVHDSFAVEFWRRLPDSDSTLGRHRVLCVQIIPIKYVLGR